MQYGRVHTKQTKENQNKEAHSHQKKEANSKKKNGKFQPIYASRTFLVMIRLSGKVLLQGQLEKEAKRLMIAVTKFHNFP